MSDASLKTTRPPVPRNTQSMVVREIDHWPDLIALHRASKERYPFLLESAAHDTAQGQFDILFGFPEEEIYLQADEQGLVGKPDF